MTKFIFDLDGTVTKEETLPIIAKHFSVEEEIEKLTKQTVMGHIPFVESFIRRHRENCAIATGNLSCWVAKLVERLGCEVYCSEGQIENNQVVKLTDILKKESVVEKYRAEGHRVVFIGDGNNDVEAMRAADVAIASGLTHAPTASVISVADYLVLNEVALCRQLNQLL